MESYAIRDLSFYYPSRQTPALDGIDLTVRQGEFIAICGPSGCGKSTLLRQLKPILAPHGRRAGEILFCGGDINALDQKQQAAQIGFVQQSPESQIVTDMVWHELAFGLESLGAPTPVIRTRVAEMASFFGIQGWFHMPVSQLSGGQKQLLNLASVMAMQPSVLILDEPTSQLDPIAASDFLAAVAKINRELGVTVIITEHRLEEALPLCDRVLVMEKGRIVADGAPPQVGAALLEAGSRMFAAFPTPMRVWAAVNNNAPCPVTVRQGRQWLDSHIAQHGPAMDIPEPTHPGPAPVAVELREVFFRYEQAAPDVLKGMSLKVNQGGIFALVGGNGTGKTTALSVMAGLNRPQRGQVLINGIKAEKAMQAGLMGVLPQNPQALFVCKTVAQDLAEALEGTGLAAEERQSRIDEIAGLCRLEELLEAHPYDLSGGEQQRAALAKVLLARPGILLLDEPTKGMDAQFKGELAALLKALCNRGVTVFMVSHDIEFCARYAHQVAMCFDGSVVSGGRPRDFFTGNSFYTTAANRMARAHIPGAATAEDVIAALGGQIPPEPAPPPMTPAPPVGKAPPAPPQPVRNKRRPAGIAVTAMILALTAVFLQIRLGFFTGIWDGTLAHMLDTGGSRAINYALALAVLCILAIALIFQCFPASRLPPPGPGQRQKLSKRTLAAMAVALAAIPLTIYAGVHLFGDRRYYFISLLIMLEAMLPFAISFESRRPQARELVIVAVLCAVGVAGRAAFFMLPQFKPVAAVVIIAGVAFGGETGFLVGAITAFASNLFFGQGPWTPWQMFAFGMIGLLAGVLFGKGILGRSRIALAVFGALAAFAVYGGIMNPASVLMYQSQPAAGMFWLAYLRGAPFDLVHGAATAFFLAAAGPAMLEKLDRIKQKYGLIEM